MIITKTPLRVSLVGGGSDIPQIYESGYPGQVVSFTIDKFIWIFVNRKYDGKIRLSYSRTENVNNVNEIKHEIVREAMNIVGIHSGVEIVSIADIPFGTGLGSSGAFTVGLLNALHALRGNYISDKDLAEEAAHIEINVLHKSCGKQDHYSAVYGGINHIKFSGNDVSVERIHQRDNFALTLETYISLFKFGESREASSILDKVDMFYDRICENVSKLSELSISVRESLEDYSFGSKKNIEYLGSLINSGWDIKKTLLPDVSNIKLDNLITDMIRNGALGAKLLGAGKSGYILVVAQPEERTKIANTFPGNERMHWNFCKEGTQVIIDE